MNAIHEGTIPSGQRIKDAKALAKQLQGLGMDKDEAKDVVWIKETNVLVDATKGPPGPVIGPVTVGTGTAAEATATSAGSKNDAPRPRADMESPRRSLRRDRCGRGRHDTKGGLVESRLSALHQQAVATARPGTTLRAWAIEHFA